MSEITLTGLKGKRVLITGASGSIGSVAAELFGRAGAITGIHYCKNKHAALEILKKIEAENSRAFLIRANLQDFRQLVRLVERFCGETGGIDILVNCAGGFSEPSHFETMEVREWDRVINLNFSSVFFSHARGVFKNESPEIWKNYQC